MDSLHSGSPAGERATCVVVGDEGLWISVYPSAEAARRDNRRLSNRPQDCTLVQRDLVYDERRFFVLPCQVVFVDFEPAHALDVPCFVTDDELEHSGLVPADISFDDDTLTTREEAFAAAAAENARLLEDQQTGRWWDDWNVVWQLSQSLGSRLELNLRPGAEGTFGEVQTTTTLAARLVRPTAAEVKRFTKA